MLNSQISIMEHCSITDLLMFAYRGFLQKTDNQIAVILWVCSEREGEVIRMKNMKYLLVIILGIVIITSSFASTKMVKGDEWDDTMKVLPRTVGNGCVGQMFNVTVFLSMTENIFSYQVKMHFNSTQLNCTGVAFTAGLTSEYFSGHTAIALTFINNTEGIILFFESCIATDSIVGTAATLVHITFQILQIPSKTVLDISSEYGTNSTAKTWIYNQDASARLQFTPYNGICICCSIDLDHDGVIDGSDLSIVARAFGSYPEHPRWNPIADINMDGIVDGGDLALVAKYFGQKAGG